MLVICVVLSFKKSENLAAAYGIAVTTTMLITTFLAVIVMRRFWKWNRVLVTVLGMVFLIVDLSFFAANLLKGHTVKIPTFVVPGSTEVHADMKRLNLRGVPKDTNEKSIEDILNDAGCLIGPSGCAACLGGPSDTFGRLNDALTCISTTNRNFPGRMGSTKSAVYLASPLASATTGAAVRVDGGYVDSIVP